LSQVSPPSTNMFSGLTVAGKIEQKKTSCLQMEVRGWLHPDLLHQLCSSRHPYSTKGGTLIVSGRSSDSRSTYFLHLPNMNASGFMQISSRSQRRDRGWFSQPSLLFL